MTSRILSTRTRYSTVAIVLHWLIALAVISNWLIARLADGAPKDKAQELMGTHFALGLTVLILSLLRLGWRLMHATPPPNPAHRPWERLVARVVHKLFYVLIIALPLSGYMMVQTHMGGQSISMFGLFTVPGIDMAKDKVANAIFHGLHENFVLAMLVLLFLHVLGILKHQLLDRDGTIMRMLPFGR